jgi:hypothetical protein
MKTVNFTHKRGDTFAEVPINIKINNVDLDLTGSTILMQLRKEAGGIVAFTPSLTIEAGTGGNFSIDEQIIDIPACNYKYDIQITLADDTVSTWISGLFSINDDISR